jgi:hypothetical protein
MLLENGTKMRHLTKSKVLWKKTHLHRFIRFLLDLVDPMRCGAKHRNNAGSTFL